MTQLTESVCRLRRMLQDARPNSVLSLIAVWKHCRFRPFAEQLSAEFGEAAIHTLSVLARKQCAIRKNDYTDATLGAWLVAMLWIRALQDDSRRSECLERLASLFLSCNEIVAACAMWQFLSGRLGECIQTAIRPAEGVCQNGSRLSGLAFRILYRSSAAYAEDIRFREAKLACIRDLERQIGEIFKEIPADSPWSFNVRYLAELCELRNALVRSSK